MPSAPICLPVPVKLGGCPFTVDGKDASQAMQQYSRLIKGSKVSYLLVDSASVTHAGIC